MRVAGLEGCRVLVVEDELMVALMLEDVLDQEHCVIVGPFAELTTALAAASVEQIDLALLDVNLGGILSFPIAEVLARRGIPFLFLTGYGEAALERTVPAHRHWPVCSKPFNIEHLVSVMEGIVDTTPDL